MVNVSGGTIGYENGGPVNGNVFGSGRGADRGYKAGAVGNKWYSPTAGRVRGNTQVNITGGTIKNNVYGGGFMASVKGNTEVNIGTKAGSPADFTIWGDVFGGSALGAIGAADKLTIVNIFSGTVGSATQGYNAGNKGNIFGGGNGEIEGGLNVCVDGTDTPADTLHAHVLSTVIVNIGDPLQYKQPAVGATVKGRVFGCNNVAGTPKNDVYVNVYSTAHEAGDGITSGNVYPTSLKAKAAPADVLDSADMLALSPAERSAFASTDRYALKAVYGGGNRASYIAPGHQTKVTVYECEENTVEQVYGSGRGGTQDSISCTQTDVSIEGGHIDMVFAGGDGSGTGNQGAYVKGTAVVTIEGGIINQVFGGSNTLGVVEGGSTVNFEPVNSCLLMLDEAFGGGNQAPSGPVTVNIPCNFDGATTVYGGGSAAQVNGDVTLNIEGGHLIHVFGGCRAADITGNVTVNVYGGSIDELFGGNDVSGNIQGKIEVNVDWGLNNCPNDTALGTVYGGGRQAPYVPTFTIAGEDKYSPLVNIIHATVSNAVFGGGLGMDIDADSDGTLDGTHDAHLGSDSRTVYTKVVVGADRVKNRTGALTDPVPNNYVRIGTAKNDLGRTLAGNVFGGGNAGPVNGDTKVVIQGSNTKVWHNVYGGGNAAIVTGNTDVEIGPAPRLSFPALTIGSDGQATLTSHEGATIHYTTNGDTPTTSSPVYSTPFAVSEGQTLKAIAAMDDYATTPVATYPIVKAATPTFTLSGEGLLTIECATLGVTTRYNTTTDGTTPAAPNESSTLYRKYFKVVNGQKVTAYATRADHLDSDPASFTASQVDAPVITPDGMGGYTIGCTTPGAIIHYTIDGDPATAYSPVYDEMLTGLPAGTTVKAIAVKDNMLNSTESTVTVP